MLERPNIEEINRKRRERESEWIESHPDSLRPLAERMVDARARATELISNKNRSRMRGSDDAELGEMEAQIETVKAEMLELQQALRKGMIEHRISEIPAERREEARMLLEQEQAEIDQVRSNPSVDPAQFGAIGGRFLSLQRQYFMAVDAGDHERAKELEPQLQAATEAKEQAQAKVERDREREKMIQEKYSRLLDQLRS